MSNSKAFDRRRFVWLDQVIQDTELPASAFKVAYRLGQMFNEEHEGESWESCFTISKATALSEATVIMMVRRLHERGHLDVTWGKQGRGHPNRYRMVLKPENPKVLEPNKPENPKVLGGKEKTLGSRKKTLGFEEENLSRLRRPNLLTQLKTKSLKLGRESNALSRVGTSDAGSPIGGQTSLEVEASNEGVPIGTASAEAGFQELDALWVRLWADNHEDGSKKLYALAREEIGHSAVVEAARAWVQAAEHPRFVKKLSKWLADRCWEREPPQHNGKAPQANGAGNRRRKKENMGAIAEAAGRDEIAITSFYHEVQK
jgi:hypothetical protein